MQYSKEYSIRLLVHENDSYNELYITTGREKKKYFVRDTSLGGWYTVCDPLGYCERDCFVSKSVLFHVCDKNGKRLFDSSNADDSSSYPCLRVLAKKKWCEVAKKYTNSPTQDNEIEFLAYAFSGNSVNRLDNWLLSFMDPDLCEDRTDLLPENWIYCRAEKLSCETLDSFNYLGEEYLIEKVTYRHTVCGVEWTEYYSAEIQMATDFDSSKVGPMYSERDARRIVNKALETLYKGNRVWTIVSWSKETDTKYAQKISLDEVARKLINGDLHRSHIDKVIEEEKKHRTFFETQTDVKSVYNDVTFLYY